MTLFGTSTAKGTLHEWLTYAVTRPVSVSSSVEGADTSFSDLTQPSRASNVTHIINQAIQVSRTERKVNVAAMGDPYAFQKADALRQLKMKMEYAILNSTKASGSSGVARTMTGLDAFITSMLLWRFMGSMMDSIWGSKILKRFRSNVAIVGERLKQELAIILSTISFVPDSVLA